MKVSCLGPAGSYSARATEKFNIGETVLCTTFRQAVLMLVRGETDACVLPIENSIQGGIRQNLDLLCAHEGIYAVAEEVLSIDHRLALLAGVKGEAVERIYSHEEALSQCGRFLQEKFPDAQIICTESTAKSLDMLDEHSAGIVGAHVRREGVVLSAENVADETKNFTHFLLLRRGKENLPAKTKKVFICVSLSHRPSSLLRFLQTIDSFGLNLTKIESRPAHDAIGEYRFFIEFEGDLSDKVVQYALPVLEERARWFRLLGAY